MATADQKPLTELFSSGYFEIPDFQRNYAWKKQQVRDLIEDIFYLHRRQSSGETEDSDVEIHYFGQILLKETANEMGSENTTIYEIIDGQQRILTVPIFVRAILDELARTDAAEIPAEEIQDSDGEARTPQELYEDELDSVENTYFRFNGRERVRPTETDQNVYRELIDRSGDVSDDDLSSPSNEYLQNAYQLIQQELRDSFFRRAIATERATDESVEVDGDEEIDIDREDIEPGDDPTVDRQYEIQLLQLLELLATVFTVTRFIIDDTSEAGRFFETENDRGRDLTTKDKIKGYLIYCANNLDIDNRENFAERISKAFKRVTETITKHEDADEETVETFLSSHWRMFNGNATYDRNSNDVTKVHRYIKQYPNHAHIERTDENLKEWIEVYITSLRHSATAYSQSRFPHGRESSEELEDETQGLLTGIKACAAPSNTGALLTAVRLAYAEDSPDKYQQILDLLEKFAFRVYQLSGESKQSQRKKMNRMAFKLHWADPSWLETFDSDGDIFDVEAEQLQDHQYQRGVDDSKRYDDLEAAYRTICDQIESAIGNYSPRSRTRNRLRRTDLLNGDDVDDNWKGVQSNDNALPYLFLNYENHQRDEATVQDPADWPNWDDDVEIYQLWNDEIDQDFGLEADVISRFDTSIAALLPIEAHQESDFDQEWNSLFEDVILSEGSFMGESSAELDVGPFATLRDFADDDDNPLDLTEETLQDVKKKRVETALERWSVDSKAYVIASNADEIEKDGLKSVVNDVRAHYKDQESGTDSYNIPHVELMSPEDAELDEDFIMGFGDLEEDDFEDPTIDDFAVEVVVEDGVATYSPCDDTHEEHDDEEMSESDEALATPPYLLDRVYWKSDENEEDSSD